MGATDQRPGPFITTPGAYETRQRQSAETHARVAHIGVDEGFREPAVGIFRGRTFLAVLNLEDAHRLNREITSAIRQHPEYRQE